MSKWYWNYCQTHIVARKLLVEHKLGYSRRIFSLTINLNLSLPLLQALRVSAPGWNRGSTFLQAAALLLRPSMLVQYRKTTVCPTSQQLASRRSTERRQEFTASFKTVSTCLGVWLLWNKRFHIDLHVRSFLCCTMMYLMEGMVLILTTVFYIIINYLLL
jgi:hypothetical protein